MLDSGPRRRPKPHIKQRENAMENYDVIILGGGAAGLAAAQALGRARRSVVVIDSGTPRNAPAEGVHNYLTRDGINPLELAALGAKEMQGYGGVLLCGEAIETTQDETGFTVTLGDGGAVHGRKILLATGIRDELPAITGLAEHWGRDAMHCPYCHGWEARDKALGVIDSNFAVHQALMFRQWSSDITLFRDPGHPLSEEEAEQLAARGITVIGSAVASVQSGADGISGVVLDDGTTHAVSGLVLMPRGHARAQAVEALGLIPAEHPSGFGTWIESDAMGATSVPGVRVAGNITDLSAQVMASAARGLLVGAAINMELTNEEMEADVARYRASRIEVA